MNSTIKIVPGPVFSKAMRFTSAEFSADGAFVVTTSNGDCDYWDAASGQHVRRVVRGAPDYQSESDYFRRQVDALYPQTAEELEAVERFAGMSDLAVTSPDRRLIALGSSSWGGLYLLNLDTNSRFTLRGHPTSMNNNLHQNAIKAMLFDASSSYLISMAEEDDAPLLWDLSKIVDERIEEDATSHFLDHPIQLNKTTSAGIDTISFSPVGSKFITTHRTTNSAAIWEIATDAGHS